MEAVPVTCGIIINDKKILICRRKPGKALAGYWEFPGGKIEPGESAETCLVRELKEELNISIKEPKHFLTTTHNYTGGTIILIAFVCDYVHSEICLIDHDAYQWIEVSELFEFHLSPADEPIAEALCNTTLT